MEKRFVTHLAGVALGLAVIFGGSTLYYAQQQKQLEAYITIQHQKSLSQLLSSTDQLETSLKKAACLPAGAMRQTLAADIWKESQLASAALSALPLGEEPLEQLESYISKVGDYAYYLMRSSAYGRTDEQEWNTLCSLRDNLNNVLTKISVLKEQVDTGTTDFRSVTTMVTANDGVTASLSTLNDEFPEYASLIYDGPYSDHVSQRTAQMLEGQPLISEEEAQHTAASVLRTEPEQIALVYDGAGQIPCYGFHNGETAISITKQGGNVLSLSRQAGIGTDTVSTEQALKQAAAFLDDLGYTGMQHSYYTVYENIITINYHAVQDEVLFYPDLIKVGVSLAGGNVVHLDATGYLMNHKARTISAPVISESAAASTIPQNLQLLEVHQACIPTTGYHEVLCWELVCENADGSHVLLYVNCETGQIENLLLLIEQENGTLTR